MNMNIHSNEYTNLENEIYKECMC